MSDVSRRLARLEEAAGATAGPCECKAYGGGPLSGAVVSEGDAEPTSERCPACGGYMRPLAVAEQIVGPGGLEVTPC